MGSKRPMRRLCLRHDKTDVSDLWMRQKDRSSGITVHGARFQLRYLNVGDRPWPPPMDGSVHCINDGEPILGPADEAIPMPRRFDQVTGTFDVCVGRVACSFACAKRWAMDRRNSGYSPILGLLARMARRVYGLEGGIQAAPVTDMLVKFGGPFSTERYRSVGRGEQRCRINACDELMQPYQVIVTMEDDVNVPVADPGRTEWDIRGLDRPGDAVASRAAVPMDVDMFGDYMDRTDRPTRPSTKRSHAETTKTASSSRRRGTKRANSVAPTKRRRRIREGTKRAKVAAE